MENELILLPAIDVVDGQAVRLTQGELSEKSVYGDPLEVAMAFAQAGAEWIHFVDLDAAFEFVEIISDGLQPAKSTVIIGSLLAIT